VASVIFGGGHKVRATKLMIRALVMFYFTLFERLGKQGSWGDFWARDAPKDVVEVPLNDLVSDKIGKTVTLRGCIFHLLYSETYVAEPGATPENLG